MTHELLKIKRTTVKSLGIHFSTEISHCFSFFIYLFIFIFLNVVPGLVGVSVWERIFTIFGEKFCPHSIELTKQIILVTMSWPRGAYVLARIRFGYKFVCSQFTTTHYVTVYKTINMYYLKKSHNSLNRSCD